MFCKHKFISYLVLFSVTAAPLSAQQAHADRETVGGIIGAIIGGATGSNVGSGRGRIAATVLGAVVGGYLGAEVGEELDEADEARARGAYLQSLEGGMYHQYRWEGRDRRETYGTFISTSEYPNSYGERCRAYTSETYSRRRRTIYQGVSCLGPSGWYSYETTTTIPAAPDYRRDYRWGSNGSCEEINSRGRLLGYVDQGVCRDRVGTEFRFEETEFEIRCIERTIPNGFPLRNAPIRNCRGER